MAAAGKIRLASVWWVGCGVLVLAYAIWSGKAAGSSSAAPTEEAHPIMMRPAGTHTIAPDPGTWH
jgi:hypothetical protein